MALKSVVEIEIDDTKFQAWLKQPHNVALGVDSGKASKTGDTPMPGKTKPGTPSFKDDSTIAFKGFAKQLESATKSLLKIAAIGGIGGALATSKLAGMANSVEQQRFQSRGLGVSAAEKKAFDINYRTLVNTDDLLSRVNEALTDYSKRASLYGAGLSESDIAGKSVVEVAEMLIPAMKQTLEQGDKSAQYAQAHGITQFIDTEGQKRLLAARSDEIAAIHEKTKADMESLKLAPEIQDKWIEMSKQMTRAGEQIENSLVKTLVPLAPLITRLSESLVGLIDGIGKWSQLLGFDEKKTGGRPSLSELSGSDRKYRLEELRFKEAVKRGEVNMDFAEDLSPEDKKELIHDWAATQGSRKKDTTPGFWDKTKQMWQGNRETPLSQWEREAKAQEESERIQRESVQTPGILDGLPSFGPKSNGIRPPGYQPRTKVDVNITNNSSANAAMILKQGGVN